MFQQTFLNKPLARSLYWFVRIAHFAHSLLTCFALLNFVMLALLLCRFAHSLCSLTRGIKTREMKQRYREIQITAVGTRHKKRKCFIKNAKIGNGIRSLKCGEKSGRRRKHFCLAKNRRCPPFWAAVSKTDVL